MLRGGIYMNKMYILLSALISAVIVFTTSVKAEITQINEDEILIVDVTESNSLERGFNWVKFPTTSNEKEVIIKIENTGTSSLDNVKINVQCAETGLGTTKTLSNVKVGTTTVNIGLEMLVASETIKVKFTATEKGTTKTTDTTITRKISATHLNKWNKGSFSSSAASLNYHFKKHGSGVGATNIVQYHNKADAFRQNLSGASVSNVSGSVSGVKRYKKLGKYIDLDPNKLIVSFGKQ